MGETLDPAPLPDDILDEAALGDAKLLADRPFRWMVFSNGIVNLAFWAYFGVLFAQATFEFGVSSTRQTALLGAALSVPFIFATLIQGFFIDRWSAKWLFILGQVLTVAAIAVAWSATSIDALYLSSFLVGLSAAAMEPARSTLTSLQVAREDLVRANGILAISFQSALFLGTLLGGLMLQSMSYQAVYVVCGLIALACFPFSLAMTDVRAEGERPKAQLSDLARGLTTSWRIPQLRLLLLVTSVGWMVFNAFFVLEPLFIRYVLKQPESAINFLWSASGFGAILGAVAVSRFKKAAGKELIIVGIGVVTIGAGLLIYAGTAVYALAFPGSALMGVGLAFLFPAALALVQRVAPESEQGRVSSVLLSMQEILALVISLIMIAGAFPISVVQGALLAVAVALVIVGAVGVRAARKLEARDG